MKISWVYASGFSLDPAIDVEKIKSIGPTWGSWKTWRPCGTDNVVCYDLGKSRELIHRAFHAVCNFYVPRNFYTELGSPKGVKLYDGDFKIDCDDIEDIICCHLAGNDSDIVLLLGFDLAKPILPEDRFETHKIKNRHGLLRASIAENANTQWVIVDHPGDLDKAYQTLPNLTCDKMENVIQLLV